MGYTTDFNGRFELNKPLTVELATYLVKFNESRRMKRNVNELMKTFHGKGGLPGKIGLDAYGIDGEFFVEGQGFMGQDRDNSVMDGNRPSHTQPGLWCQWRPTDDGKAIEWDGGEKFYCYVEWLEYLIDNVLAPNGYKLNGAVQWRGEDFNDLGTIIVQDNKVKTVSGKHVDLPKAKPAPKAKKDDNFVIESHKHGKVTYFKADSLLDALKKVDSENDPKLTRALIKMLSDIAAK